MPCIWFGESSPHPTQNRRRAAPLETCHESMLEHPVLMYGMRPGCCRGCSKLVNLAQSRATQQMVYYRGLNNYLCYFGGALLLLYYNGPQNPILIIEKYVYKLAISNLMLGFYYRLECSRVDSSQGRHPPSLHQEDTA